MMGTAFKPGNKDRLRNKSCASVFVACAMAFVSSISAAKEPNEVADFLFSQDNQIVGTAEQYGREIQSKSLVQEDKWLNAPLTRLDYVLIKIRSTLTANLMDSALREAHEFFENGKFLPPSVEFSAGYSDATGRLNIGASIENLGKPKKPMKEFCERILLEIEQWYPLKPIGYSWHNSALGLLRRDSSPDRYDDIVQKLAQSTVINVQVTSVHPATGRDALYIILCKQEAGRPPTFYKSSHLF